MEAVAGHNNWKPHEKDKNLPAAMPGEAAEILHDIFTKATYEEFTVALEDCYED
jgi:hypothetical protein